MDISSDAHGHHPYAGTRGHDGHKLSDSLVRPLPENFTPALQQELTGVFILAWVLSCVLFAITDTLTPVQAEAAQEMDVHLHTRDITVSCFFSIKY